MIRPLFARVLLEREKKTKEGSILIPDEAQKRYATHRCTVIATGPSCDPSIQPGQSVILGRHSGDWINEDGKPLASPNDREFYIAMDEDILAVVDD